jgi:hypothetical protein
MKKMFLISLIFVATQIHAKQINFYAVDKEKLKDICSEACGAEFTEKVEVRDFEQLKHHKEKASRVGLTCFRKVEWLTGGTACHVVDYHQGIHRNGLAPTRTELHGGSWATKQGGAWCISYDEKNHPGMSRAIKAGEYKAGQVACVSGVKLDSLN